MPSLLPVEEDLLILISNTVLIFIAGTLLVLVCFNLLYSGSVEWTFTYFLNSHISLHQRPSSIWNSNICFQVCLYFTMHHGSLHCPFSVNNLKDSSYWDKSSKSFPLIRLWENYFCFSQSIYDKTCIWYYFQINLDIHWCCINSQSWCYNFSTIFAFYWYMKL